MNTENLSNVELATCVDEFFKRVMNSLRDSGIEGAVSLNVMATQHSKSAEYKIEHKATVGDWQKSQSSTTNSLMTSGHNAAARWLEDQVQQATTIRPMIEHLGELESETDEQE